MKVKLFWAAILTFAISVVLFAVASNTALANVAPVVSNCTFSPNSIPPDGATPTTLPARHRMPTEILPRLKQIYHLLAIGNRGTYACRRSHGQISAHEHYTCNKRRLTS